MTENVAITENEYLLRVESREVADLYFDVDVEAVYMLANVDAPETEDDMSDMLAADVTDADSRWVIEGDDTVTWTDLRVEHDVVGGFTVHGRVTVAGKRYDTDWSYDG